MTPNEFSAWQQKQERKGLAQNAREDFQEKYPDGDIPSLTANQFGQFLFIMSYMSVWPHEGFLMLSKYLSREGFNGYRIIPGTRIEKRFEIMGRFCEAVEVWRLSQPIESLLAMQEQLMVIPTMAEFMANELGALSEKVRNGEL